MKKLFKTLVSFGITLVVMASLTSCDSMITSTGEEKSYTQTLMSQSNDVVGFPDVINFFEKGQLKEIYEYRDDPDLICYWYTYNQMTGKWNYQSKCIGYGIPYTTQYTQPEAIERQSSTYGYAVTPQADPNGLYSSNSTSATWVLSLVDGEVQPEYVESEIYVTQSKIEARRCDPDSLPEDY